MAHFCSIVPPHVLKHIVNSPLTIPPTLVAAQKTYDHICRLHDKRVQGDYIHDQESQGFAAEARTTTHHVYRKIYTSAGTNEMKKKLVFDERARIPFETMDWDAKNVYDYFEKTYEFYNEVFNRNSIDDRGLHMIGSIHYDDQPGPPGYNNAFWNGREMGFGDGDGDLFTNFTDNIDIIGHELTHGVVQLTADLEYYFQSGALNESISDVFGSMIKQYHSETLAKDADWLIGEGIFHPSVDNSPALRSMKSPGCAYDNPKIGRDPQPATMDGYQDLQKEDDGGGVHINSGIPNHAFYLASVALGGYSWEKAGKIWYAALTDRALRSVDSKDAFKVFADLTVKHAGAFDKDTQEKVRKAWIDVKVLDGKDEL
ncbi:hypothetical protein OCU04_011242 [Sclerotinia nivalis]|uniref:Uncharacterized protein n=1 Tax=Sclerotinia nivalis TaxID=352851 RepID=A0A9X0AB95_9HELO|nr:hypothetical protein OCU04_011242 [Sclerotinia nivalis]